VLALAPAKMEDYIILGGPLVLALILLVIPFVANRGERSPLRRPWAVAVALLTVVMVVVNTILGLSAPWSPNFAAKALSEQVVGTAAGPVAQGAVLFHDKGCEYCHQVEGEGGKRGPNLSRVAGRLTPDQMTVRILNGGTNMPAFANNLTPEQLDDLIAFLKTRRD